LLDPSSGLSFIALTQRVRNVFDFCRATITNAQSIMEEYALKPRDAIHAATALTNGLHRILSFDKDFDAIPDLTRIEPGREK